MSDVGAWLRGALVADMRQAAPRVHLPLRRSQLCLSCDAISAIGRRCPACAGDHCVPLARWLDRAPVTP